ncbi:MAG: DUF2752 domain-containing protein [Bacteroidaceae bacterium]|nr:DUF2752 domain-containing protein [Bacteroidaceae bacterium]
MAINKGNFYHITAILIIIGVVVIILIVYGAFPWRCPINYFFEVKCPGCGVTRAVHAILLGDFYGSMILNPLGIIIICTFIFSSLVFFLDLIFKKQWLYHIYIRTLIFIDNNKIVCLSIIISYVIIHTIFKNIR